MDTTPEKQSSRAFVYTVTLLLGIGFSGLLLWLGVKRDWSDPAEKAGVQFGGAQV